MKLLVYYTNNLKGIENDIDDNSESQSSSFLSNLLYKKIHPNYG